MSAAVTSHAAAPPPPRGREPPPAPRAGAAAVPVARPLLPPAEALLPYLRRIDAARVYANWGPLNAELEGRLAAHAGPGAHAVALASGTAGLVCALRACLEDRPAPLRRGLCLLPAWTFAATAQAAVAAGLTPCFLDADEGSWALEPDAVADALLRRGRPPGGPAPVSAIVAVAPFGRPLDPAPWDALAARTGVPVVIDAAAAFDGLRVGRAPAVVSLHATKTVGAGEGGFAVTADADLARRVRRQANFGFLGARVAEVAGTNAKLSEYHAAVALAALDAWPGRREALRGAAALLRARLAPLGCRFQEGWGERWASSSCVVRLPDGARAEEVALRLGLLGVGARAWWGGGCHTHPAFEACPRLPDGDRLPNTARLASATLGLPFFHDLGEAEADRVAGALRAALA